MIVTPTGLPTPEQAEVLLREAAARNPGPWEAHSHNAAEAARRIAEHCPGMDPEVAHTMALLHDVGRRYGVTSMRHALDGYRYLMELGFDRAARACMLHSFPLPDMDAAFGTWDCTAEEYAIVENYVYQTVYDDYDRLTQICDALADASGFCLMEKRFIDVAIRHGVMEKAPPKWKAWLQTREYFEEKMGCSLYRVLPGIVDCTFGAMESIGDPHNTHRQDNLHGVPIPRQAEELLREAAARNPGPWEAHSRNAAEAARRIAERCPGMDPQAAFAMALLHDIGHRYGVTAMRHTLDGYQYLMDLGYDRAAKVCLTHSFDYKDIETALGDWDCTPEEYAFVKQYLDKTTYDDYDRLIQICDALAASDGFCLMEKRYIDVALRHGTTEKAPLKWKAALQTRVYFESKMGCSVYSVLPGVVEGTFGFTPA